MCNRNIVYSNQNLKILRIQNAIIYILSTKKGQLHLSNYPYTRCKKQLIFDD